MAEIIETAYGAGLGPHHVAKMTGYGADHVCRLGRMFGFRAKRGAPKLPDTLPPSLFVLLAKYNLCR